MDKLVYYRCNKCQDPYFGGLKQCLDMAAEEERKQKEQEKK